MNAIEKIHQFNRFGSRLGLERMTVLLEKLGNPHEDLDVIHVAGTNGKGSVCKYLEEGLSACGYKVGLYTSPFIEEFNERICLGGENISNEDLQSFTERVLKASDEMVAEGLDSPTEFEVVTAIAFLYFKEKGADITVLEVGLGGSGDSTNVVKKPLACAITSIAFDHMDRLGNTLAEIAVNKAGIIKEGVPVISNVPEREAAVVIAGTAYEKNSKLYDISKNKFMIFDETPFSQKVSMDIYGTDYSDVEISMTGKHQGENLKTALAIIEVLRKERKIKVERSKLYEGLKQAVQPGRFEVLVGKSVSGGEADAGQYERPMVIIDGAHNEAGACALRETVSRYFEGQRVLLVTGMLADKQVDDILKHFTAITDKMIITEPDNPRKLSVDRLGKILNKMGIEPVKAKDAREGVKLAESMQGEYDLILFAGSLYLIGDVRRIVRNEWGKGN
ncbi:MAG: folylpolyglutamate synthase/dihydrofolate synthase family protein [Bacillota bacterium]|nr:folylpolyglutamate synthase/dihydrofolate synthase family protein [Bacillota bacterium]